jgi:hypothetical protein
MIILRSSKFLKQTLNVLDRLMQKENQDKIKKDLLQKMFFLQMNLNKTMYHAYNASHVDNLVYKYEKMKMSRKIFESIQRS